MRRLFQRRNHDEEGESSQASKPFGLALWHDGPDAEVDIIFVHGLMGQREKTWRGPAQNATLEPWPKQFLPSRFPNTRIFSFGYDARVVKPRGGDLTSKLIGDHAGELITCLAHERQRTKTVRRPVIFVCHSLGGLVCKDGFINTNGSNKEQFEDVSESTCGFIFMGTPHSGSAIASYASLPAKMLGSVTQTNRQILGILKTNSELLGRIHDEFCQKLSSRQASRNELPIELMCFWEELESSRSITIVPKKSAVISGHRHRGIRADHKGMTKFPTMSDPGYKAFEEELAWLIDKIGNGKTPSNVSFSRHPAESIERQHANEGPWFLVPCSKNDVFVGRSSILQELDDWIGSPVENRRMGVHKRAAIQGLGGIGKTQVALQWAYKKHQEETDLSVFWVHASTAERFTDGYVSIAKTCGISDCHHNDLQLLEKVKIWLSSSCRQQPWLMIVDNADDIDVFQETEQDGSLRDRMAKFIPESPNGAILFTTRNIEVAADLAPGRHLIYVEEPSPEECVNLMKGRLPIGIYEDEDLGRLAEELGYLPLALVQATAYVKKKSLSVSQYLQSLSESGESALIRMLECEFREFGRDGGSDNRVPNAVARTWLVSFQAIERENKLAIELLNLAGCFDRQDIRRSFFVGYAENYKWYNQGLYQHLDYDIWYKHITLKLDEIERDHPNISRPVFRKPVEIGPQLHVGSTTLDDKVATSDPAMLDPQCLRVCKNDEKEREGEPRWSPTAEDVDDALALLMAYSFLTKGKEEMFTLHRLVHLVVQRQMKSKDCVAEIATKSMIIVSEEFPGSYGSECWDQIRPLMPHVNAVLNSGPKRMDCFWVAYLKAHFIHVVAGFLNITLPIDEPKKPAIIIPLMEEAVELFERTGDENFTVLAKTALAAFLVSVALPKAMEILEPLRLDASKKLGSRHGTTLYVTRKLAECYEDMGRLNDAGQLLDGAIDGFEGKANQAFWQLRDRTRVFRKQGRLEDAMVLARWLLCLAGHAVDMRNHTAAAHAVYCAASMGMNDEVLPLAHVAWYLVMTTLGERHPKALEWKEYIRLAEQCISRDILLKDIFPSVNTSVVAAEKWKNGLSQPPPSTSRIVNAILDDYKRGQDNLDGLAKDDWRRSWAWTNFQVFQDALRGYDGQYNKDGLREERIATKSILTA